MPSPIDGQTLSGAGNKPDPRKLVLVVDDEVNLLVLLKRILEKEGYRVDVAADATQGLAKMRHLKPDLVILDLMMPGLSGIDVCKKIRAEDELHHLNIIFLSVRERKEVEEDLINKLGILAHIQKPFSVQELLKSVALAIEGKPTLNVIKG